MRILVTGSSGRIGSCLIKVLQKVGHEVVGFDLALPRTGEYTFIKGEIKNREAVKKATKGVDAVVHLAAYFTEEVIPNYWDGWDVNVGGTFNILQASVENKVRKFIFASSISTTGVFTWIGPNPHLEYFPVDEKHPFRAQDLYGVSKIVGENLCSLYSAKFGITTMCMRFACVWLDPGRVGYMKEIIEGVKNPESLLEKPWGIRDAVWEYVGIDDVAQACKLALEKEAVGYNAYNIGAVDTPTDWSSLKLAMSFYPGTPIRDPELFLHSPKKPLWDISKAQRDLGYRPKSSWKDFLS